MATSATPAARHAAILSHAARALRGVAVLSPWLVQLLAADVLLSLMLPLKPCAPVAVYNASSALAGCVWAWLQAIFTRLNRANIVLSTNCAGGLPRGESAVVVANHIAWSDVYMIQEAAHRAGMLGRCRWFAKRSLRWVPFLGWGLWAMGMPLVSRSWTTDRSELENVFRGIVSNRQPVWLISFSEGTRHTPARHAAAVARRLATGQQPLLSEHTLMPRTRGFVATVAALRHRAPHVRAVLDFTIAYARGTAFMHPPPFWETIANGNLSAGVHGYRFYAHIDRWPIDDLPEGDEELAAWLEQRWLEKGKRLERLKETLDKGEWWVAHEDGLGDDGHDGDNKDDKNDAEAVTEVM